MTESQHYLSAELSATGTILCRLTTAAQHPAKNVRFCFSLLDRCQVIRGGTITNSLGGFCEIELADELAARHPADLEIAYVGHGHKVMNRAWLPLGAYLKFEDGRTEPVTPSFAGVRQPVSTLMAKDSTGLKLVPPPTKWLPQPGMREIQGFQLAKNSSFSDTFQTVHDLAERNNFAPFMANSGAEVSITQKADLSPANYILKIQAESISLDVADGTGAFYGAITLLNLRETYGGNLPLGTIIDGPRFSWRGQHLDCARHFYEPATLFRFIDMMALLKLNVFHWHFSDDEAFRLEISCHPKAWQQTAFRGEGQTIPGLFGGGAGPYGGSYSIDTARELVAHAKKLEIDILPEIEFPAHCLALARVYPEFRDPNDTGTEMSVQSYPMNVVNPAIPETMQFFRDIVTEVAEIFPFAHVHLGGDELPPGTWGGSPAVAELLASNSLGNSQDVMAYAMRDIAKHVTQSAARPCAWEEAGQGHSGGVKNNALLFSWTSQGPGLEAARNGYDVVMCPGQHAYLDMAHTNDPDDWGASWAAIINLGDTVNWDPVPSTEPDLAKNILGVQGTFWSEFTTQDRQMEPMIAPRILGIASKAWSPEDTFESQSIQELARAYGILFDTIGWDWHRGAIDAP